MWYMMLDTDCRIDEGIQLFKAGEYLVIHSELIAQSEGLSCKYACMSCAIHYSTWQMLSLQPISDDFAYIAS